ncbi:hypothetical protein VTK26DRAFT_8615 [Humicola hyalothermophila]
MGGPGRSQCRKLSTGFQLRRPEKSEDDTPLLETPRVQRPPSVRANKSTAPTLFFGSMKAKQVDARRLAMAARAPNFSWPVP